jgi:two-component system response regulator VanR
VTTTLGRVRVLVAEDERRVADAVARGLRREGMAVDVAYDGSSALDKARLNPYDVVVLDRDLPLLHGDEVCRTLRDEKPDRRVLMLTAASGVDDLVDGLSLGADDYLAKPFAFAELVARLQALARRSNPARPPTLQAGDLALDPARHTVTRGGREIELTPKEFAVLEALMAADGAVVSNDELVARVWDENADPFTNSVRMTVLRLRRKLGDPPVVETVKGAGYRV